MNTSRSSLPSSHAEAGKSADPISAARREAEQALIGSRDGSRSPAGSHNARGQAGREALPADSIPGYELLAEVHRGGQGVVFQAIQKSTGRRVAVKVMKEGPFAGPADRARFEREVRILGALQHPCIVTIHDSGTAVGSHYFTMDYIAGQPLDVHVADLGRPLRPVLELFVRVCEAVHAAHLLGVVHRDLKPGNIRVDAGGTPHVLDFGLAKSVNDADRHSAPMTQTGQFLGSLPWASPEQVRGSDDRIGVRTDVYSLGVVLYQLLTGHFPYPVVGPIGHVLNNIQTAEPVRPRRLRGHIDDDLETIVLRCLNKEPLRRYADAGELAADLRAYLRNEPIAAKRDSSWYLLRKTLTRHRRSAALAASFITVVTGSAVALFVLYGKRGSLLAEVQRQRDKAVVAERLAERKREEAEKESYLANIAAADAAVAADDGGFAMRRLQQAQAALRNWEWRYLRRQADASVATFHGPPQQRVGQVAFSPDARYLAALSWMEGFPTCVEAWDLSSRAVVLKETAEDSSGMPFRFTGNGAGLTVCQNDGSLARFDLPAGTRTLRSPPLEEFGLPGGISPQGTYLVSSSGAPGSPKTTLWDTASGKPVARISPRPGTWITNFAFSADDAFLAVASNDGVVSVWEAAGGNEVACFRAYEDAIYGLAFRPDGRWLATGDERGTIKLWEVSEAPVSESLRGDPKRGTSRLGTPPKANATRLAFQEVRRVRSSIQRVCALAFSPDGSMLAAASFDKTARIWNVADGALLATLRGHAAAVACVAFTPDGSLLASGSFDSTAKIWDWRRPAAVLSLSGVRGIVGSVAFSGDGSRIMSGCSTADVLISDAADGRPLYELRDLPTSTNAFLLHEDGERVTSGCRDGTIRTWDVASGQEARRHQPHQEAVATLALSPDGTRLASAGADSTVVLTDAESGQQLDRLPPKTGPICSLAFSPDGSRLACGSIAGEVVLWEVASGRQFHAGRWHDTEVMRIAFSPDGRRVATASADATIRISDAASGRPLQTLHPQIGDVWCVAFSPDGTRLAASGRDRTVRLFDAGSGQELLTLRGPTGTVMCLAFSPDGRRIAAGSWTREVFIWDAGDH